MGIGSLLLASIPSFAATFVVWRSKVIIDVYKVRDEIMRQMVMLSFILAVYTAAFIFFQINYDYSEQAQHQHRLERFIYLLVSTGITIALGHFPVIYAIYLAKKAEKEAMARIEASKQVGSPSGDELDRAAT